MRTRRRGSNATGGGGGSGGISSRSTQTRARGRATRKQLLLGLASHEARRPRCEAVSVAAASSPAAARSVTYGDLLGGKLFNFTMPAGVAGSSSATATQFVPGAGIAKPVSQYGLVGKSVHADRHPGEGERHLHLHPQRPGPGHAAWPCRCGRVARVRIRSVNHQPLSVDASLDRAHPGRSGRADGQLPRRRRSAEYDAIQAAAQLKVVWKNDPKFTPAPGNYWSWMRQAGDTNTVNPARYTADTGNVDAALASAAHKVSATYRYHYNSFVPIGPHAARSPTSRRTVAIDLRAARQISAGARRRTSPTVLGSPFTPSSIRVIFYEGASSFGGGQQRSRPASRLRSCRRRSVSRFACS